MTSMDEIYQPGLPEPSAVVVTTGTSYIQFNNGGWLPAGGMTFKLEPGEYVLEPGGYVIPPGVMLKSHQTTVSASGCFTGSFMFQPAPVPDADGWEPRVKWDR